MTRAIHKPRSQQTKHRSAAEIHANLKVKLAKHGMIKVCRVSGCSNTNESRELERGVCPDCIAKLKRQLQIKQAQELDELVRMETYKGVGGIYS